MSWPYAALLALAAMGAVGVCLIVAAFVLVWRQGGWKRAMQQPIAERRWPSARRLMLIGASLALLFAIGMVVLRFIPGGIPWLDPPAQADLPSRLVGEWEMADGSDYVIEFTRAGTMRVRNKAGESQVLLAGDEFFPYRFLSDTVVGVPNRTSDGPDGVAYESAGFCFVFAISIEQDRLTIRGQREGDTIILSQDGVNKVRFPGSVSQPLEFIRRK